MGRVYDGRAEPRVSSTRAGTRCAAEAERLAPYTRAGAGCTTDEERLAFCSRGESGSTADERRRASPGCLTDDTGETRRTRAGSTTDEERLAFCTRDGSGCKAAEADTGRTGTSCGDETVLVALLSRHAGDSLAGIVLIRSGGSELKPLTRGCRISCSGVISAGSKLGFLIGSTYCADALNSAGEAAYADASDLRDGKGVACVEGSCDSAGESVVCAAGIVEYTCACLGEKHWMGVGPLACREINSAGERGCGKEVGGAASCCEPICERGTEFDSRLCIGTDETEAACITCGVGGSDPADGSGDAIAKDPCDTE